MRKFSQGFTILGKQAPRREVCRDGMGFMKKNQKGSLKKKHINKTKKLSILLFIGLIT